MAESYDDKIYMLRQDVLDLQAAVAQLIEQVNSLLPQTSVKVQTLDR